MSLNAPIPALPLVAPVPTLDHEWLEVYQRALEFHTLVLTLLPPRGFRTLRDQLERASLGAVLCIAEGARPHLTTGQAQVLRNGQRQHHRERGRAGCPSCAAVAGA